MTRFISKELRTLLVPAGLALAATLAGALGTSDGALAHLPRWLFQLFQLSYTLAFLVGTPAIAAESFGSEFRHGTMTLLLSQPVSRARVWAIKWLCVLGVLSVLVAVEWASLPSAATARFVGAGAAFFVMVVLSAPLWTLVARSTIGGFALTTLAIVWLQFAIGYAWSRLAGAPGPPFGAVPVIGVMLVYAAGTFWFGWRLFARFEPARAGFGSLSLGPKTAGSALLRPRRSSAIANIVRKELMLQRPAFVVATAFAGCWLAARLLVPPHTPLAEVMGSVLLGVYMSVAAVLPATTSVAEETSLGVRAWHLTLPVSARTQWALKVAVSVGTTLVLAVGLPALLTMRVPVMQVVVVVVGIAIVGVWAATLLGDMVKATVGMTSVVFALMLLLVAATEVQPRLRGSEWFFAVMCVPVSVAALWQSLAAFRRIHVPQRTVIWMSLTLAGVAITTASALAALAGR